jgi:hypothetical protein
LNLDDEERTRSVSKYIFYDSAVRDSSIRREKDAICNEKNIITYI